MLISFEYIYNGFGAGIMLTEAVKASNDADTILKS